ncbi:alpha-ketoglutarate dehydrogenase [Cupriavidus nantongensis]|uniref:alpha-ketoglutarate dehydrogenase n=1 Tax=Cupriavidus nantongensis TaxID=1796606 RepID=UPI00224737D2|nr:alpha-ketoglutarate dehydrogenase [Cupriavidus nantongensis]
MTNLAFPHSRLLALAARQHDDDPQETQEWLEALEAVVAQCGQERARYLLGRLLDVAPGLGVSTPAQGNTPYVNTIPVERQLPYPGDAAMEERITAIVRWNALAMVVRANKAYGELGGHISSYASAADIFEVGFNHFFRGADAGNGGDLVYFQPHSAPGVYARAYLEGRLSEAQLDNFRRESDGKGLCSYPHPWLMPDFWQFPTGSMGLGPIQAVYQARFMRYLEHRGLQATSGRHVWGVFGDGEMDEPESIAAIPLAAREKLDNLTFVINCNLQRLDGPVRGNGQIVQELEALFRGAGWNVIKVLWGSAWDPIFARDHSGALLRAFAATMDGQFQTYKAKDGHYGRSHFFGQNEELKALVAHMTPEEVAALNRGGHDLRKLHAAFAAARDHKGQPTVILAKTVKGYGMGDAGQAQNTTHQQKKLDLDALKAFRSRFGLDLSDADLEAMRFYRPADDSPELRYLQARRAALGGYLPARRCRADAVPVPPLAQYGQFAVNAGQKEMSTTMAMVRMLTALLKDKTLGPRVVPIVADEARTFGMASLFRQVGIYSSQGQLYEPEDAGSMLYYREDVSGQILEEGITEAGAMSSWIAAGTAYSTHGTAMLPLYIYYSMFGFQRIGDLVWAAGDQRARGFLVGATAGRTTLSGEGLQHQDGTSHVIAATIPNCRAYDPAYAYELAVIVDAGMRAMMERQEDVFYYLTVMNENYAQPSMPAGVEHDIVRGMYRLAQTEGGGRGKVRLLGSGAILREVEAAARMLAEDWQVDSEVFSVTSFSELEREAREVARQRLHQPHADIAPSHVEQLLAGNAPVVAATDYVRAYPQLIAPYVQAPYTVLGTDGYGRSDNRPSLRRFFEVDRAYVCVAALRALAAQGTVPVELVAQALARYGIDAGKPAPSMQ